MKKPKYISHPTLGKVPLITEEDSPEEVEQKQNYTRNKIKKYKELQELQEEMAKRLARKKG